MEKHSGFYSKLTFLILLFYFKILCYWGKFVRNFHIYLYYKTLTYAIIISVKSFEISCFFHLCCKHQTELNFAPEFFVNIIMISFSLQKCPLSQQNLSSWVLEWEKKSTFYWLFANVENSDRIGITIQLTVAIWEPCLNAALRICCSVFVLCSRPALLMCHVYVSSKGFWAILILVHYSSLSLSTYSRF